MRTIVALVIRAGEELTDEFKAKIEAAHSGAKIEYRDIDPRNARETYEEAQSAGNDVIVILRPDPLIAELVYNGVPCIPIGPGELHEIASFDVRLTPYPSE